MLRLLLAVLAAALLPVARGQIITTAYKCTDADFLSCDAELKICLGNRYIREDVERQCLQCYKAAWTCQQDCDKRFAPTFAKTCADTCVPLYGEACNPPAYVFTESGARPGATPAGMGVVAAAAAAVVAAALGWGAGRD
jgi:hypothetical protein